MHDDGKEDSAEGEAWDEGRGVNGGSQGTAERCRCPVNLECFALLFLKSFSS